jgi:hypothetical protein
MPMSIDDFSPPPGAFDGGAGFFPGESAVDSDFAAPPPGAFDGGAGFFPGEPAVDSDFAAPPGAFDASDGFFPDAASAPTSVRRRPSVAPMVQPESPPFVMVEEEFYTHPRYDGLLALVIFDPSGFFADVEGTHVACVKVSLPIGDRTLIFPLADLPEGEWVSLTDEADRAIPLEVYFDGSLRVLGRWT